MNDVYELTLSGQQNNGQQNNGVYRSDSRY